jgi:DNA (cytosine-5)-methyltransferase 1
LRVKSKLSVIDIFAGPGGLGEGFASFTDKNEGHPFDIRLSAEKDPFAQQTLELRTFLRAFRDESKSPREYADFLRGRMSREQLFAQYPSHAILARKHAPRCTGIGPRSDRGDRGPSVSGLQSGGQVTKWCKE